ncbi:MAG: response regulator [Bacteriovoracia bacterium]
MSNLKPARILLLDDENEIVDLCARVLRASYLVVKTSSPFEAVSFMDCGRTKIDLVVCDYNMPGMNGAEFVSQIRRLGIKTPVMLYTGMVLEQKEHQLEKFTRVLMKPFDAHQLREEVSASLSSAAHEAQVYHQYSGIKPHLEMATENLISFLKNRGICDPSMLDPEKALQILGPGQEYKIFLSWFYLNELSSRI